MMFGNPRLPSVIPDIREDIGELPELLAVYTAYPNYLVIGDKKRGFGYANSIKIQIFLFKSLSNCFILEWSGSS